MITHLTNIMEKIHFPKDAQSFFLEMYSNLTPEDIFDFNLLKNKFFMYEKTSKTNEEVSDEVQEKLNESALKKGWNKYSMHMLFFLYCTEELSINYEKRGVDINIFYDTMTDLTYKLNECKKMYDVYGVFTFFWFQRHFLMDLFALGRFQFEKNIFKYDSYKYGNTEIKKGDTVYSFHIPSSGPMTEEMKIDSYKKAFGFFKDHDEKYIPIVLESWLIYPENKNIFPKGSNLHNFVCDFDILYKYEFENRFPDAWRIFYRDYNGDTSEFERKTTLQRNIIEYLDNGGSIGNGYGIILFDGEKIINKK